MAVVMGKPALPGLLQLMFGIFSLTTFTIDTITLATPSPATSSLTGDNQLYRSDMRGLELSNKHVKKEEVNQRLQHTHRERCHD